MILPSKHLTTDRALLTIGGRVLGILQTPMTVSTLWDKLSGHDHETASLRKRISYDYFVLVLDLLYMIKAIVLTDGIVRRMK